MLSEYHPNFISVVFMPLPSLHPQTFTRCLPHFFPWYMACIVWDDDPVPFITPHAFARGKVIEFVFHSFFLSVTKKILRWHEVAPSKTSEHIRSSEDTPILLVPATGLIRFHSRQLQLLSYYPVHFGSQFIYSHELRPQHICHVFTYIHAHAQRVWHIQHMAKMNESWKVQSARGMCSVEL